MHSGSLHRFGCYLKEKWGSPRRIRFWLLTLFVAYTLLGFFGLPWIIQSAAKATAKEDFGRELRIESVQTNPYTLTLRINGLELDDTDNRQLLAWNRLLADLSWSSITNQAWTFKTIRLTKPVVQEERFASGETRFTRLANELSPDEPQTTEEAGPPAIQINELQVEDGVVRFADNLKNPSSDELTHVSLAIQNVGLSVTDFALHEDQRFPVTLNGQLAKGGQVQLDGELQLLPAPALNGTASINDLALNQGEPYLRQFLNAYLESGTLTLNGDIQTDTQQPFAFQGSAAVNSLSVTDGSNGETLIGWKVVETKQLELSLKDSQIESDPITLQGLSGQLVINADQSTNFSQLMIDRSTEKDAANDAEKGPVFDIVIQRIDLTDGAVEFTDKSLPLPFSTRIHTLSGEISTLSSTSAEPARVTLEGEVAEYGLMQADGAVHAWHPTRQTQVHLNFRNLQVPEYSPYTVNFAGRKIAGGTMDVDLNYTVDEGQLDGKNNLSLHDLELGEEMVVEGAMDLPLNLAIALLQDSEGVIDLTVPVSGNVGNPQFDFSQVIKQAIGNAITSVVTAPFSFLANLIGADEEELGQIEYPAGRSDLLPPQRQRIAQLREALKQRPKLVLEFAGPYNRSFDGLVLRREKAIEALQQRLAEAGRENAAPSLTAEVNVDIVEAMFSAQYPETRLDVLIDYFTEQPEEPGGEAQFDALAYRNYLAKEVIDAQSVTDSEFQAIANARAEAARDALVNPDGRNGIAADRVRILEPSEVDSVEGARIAMEAQVSAD